jgi:hypothetical protein
MHKDIKTCISQGKHEKWSKIVFRQVPFEAGRRLRGRREGSPHLPLLVIVEDFQTRVI